MVKLSVELGSAFISVSLGTQKLGPEIKQAFGNVEGTAGDAGASAGKSFQGKFSGFMAKAALPAAGVLGGIGLLAKNFGDLAAVAEQNVGAVETVFGSAAGKVSEFASVSAQSVGLSASSYNELSAVTGTALKAAGVPVDQLAAKNDELITRGADLASVFGGTTADAVGAMGAAFRGEFDTLERFGVNLTAEAINAELAARGQDNLGGAALEAAKKQATMDLIMEKSAVSAGNFAKESDTAAGAQQRSTAAWEDASAKLGEALLPIMTAVATKVSEMASWISQNAGLVTGLAIGVGVLAGAIAIWSAVQGVLNLVMLASPITWVILGIVALIAVVVALIANWDAVVQFITAVWGGFIGWITGVIAGFVGFWNDMWGQVGQFISDVWNNIVSWVSGAINNVSNTIGAVLGGIQAAWNAAWGAVGAKISEIWEGIKSGVSNGISNVTNAVSGVKDKILGALAGAGSWLVSVGKNIIQGLIDGASGMIGNAVQAVKNVGGAMLDGIKGFLGIKSPSRVFKAQVGMMIGAGVIAGVDASRKGVDASVRGLVSVPSVPAFRVGAYTAAGPSGSGGQVTNFTINQVDDPIGTAHAVARRQRAVSV